MPLLALWEKSRDTVMEFTLQQVVSIAGDGKLLDNSECSVELRKFFSYVENTKLEEYVEYCLAQSIEKGGVILQDLVNEMGDRLDYKVEHGLYQGRKGRIGFDGIWNAPDGHSLVIEVKTTDAYRINLDVVANYRAKLIDEGKIIGSSSSILIVVGRQDTGDLEAQIRGSRHAWDIRVISVDALAKLVAIKMESDEEQTSEKIRNLLKPMEYTRLDSIIEAIFTTAQDVRNDEEHIPLDATDNLEGLDEDAAQPRTQQHTPRQALDMMRKKSIAALARKLDTDLVAHKRSQFWNADKTTRAVCTVSKYYDTGNGYWYAFHPHQKHFLSEGRHSYFVLGCMNNSETYALPCDFLLEQLPMLSMTDKPNDKSYWHILIERNSAGIMELIRKKGHPRVDISRYAIKLAKEEFAA